MECMGFGKFGNSASFHLFTEKAVKTVKEQLQKETQNQMHNEYGAFQEELVCVVAHDFSEALVLNTWHVQAVGHAMPENTARL